MTRVLVVPAALPPLLLRRLSAWRITDIHSLEKPLGDAPNAAYKTVHFTASDGVELEGWYRPSRNGASVLVVSGGGSNRMEPLRHAKMLERQGYGVLVYDPRGIGNSEGTLNSYGWGWEKDVDAALDYLDAARRRRARPHRRARALDRRRHRDRRRRPPRRPQGRRGRRHRRDRLRGHQGVHRRDARPRADVAAVQDDRGDPGRSGPKVSLADRIARSRAPHLIVSAGKPEKEWGELYDKAGGDRSELWYLPKASHTAALKQYPEAYEQRVSVVLRPIPGR